MESKMKIISMYLPQFHRVKENDEWWGEGFTDWVSAKNATPIFDGHYQPHIPLDDNYYDLSERSTMVWQTDLMKQYGVDAMCIYHYWFKDGRQILEKPMENLLKWADVDMPFCICWANETWARSWSKVKDVNVWSNLHEKNADKNGKSILLEQDYGDKTAWKEHFDYLLPFFLDSRYLRQDDRPIFVFYRTADIMCLSEMVEYWQELAKDAGLKGLYVIGSNCTNNVPSVIDAELYHEPVRSRRNLLDFKTDNDAYVIEYKAVWERILCAAGTYKKTYYGGFVSYDDTPRRGKQGIVINNATPKSFEHYLTELLAKNAANNNELVFINAWNEWGEGMHLEPDERYGYDFLQSVKNAKSKYASKIDKYNKLDVLQEDYILLNRKADKFEQYLNLLDDWMSLREKNIKIDTYFAGQNINRIAVYGYGIFARHLIYELKDSNIKIECIIDKQRDKLKVDIPVVLPDEFNYEVDAIVVTSFYFMEEIMGDMNSYKGDILSIDKIIKTMRLNA